MAKFELMVGSVALTYFDLQEEPSKYSALDYSPKLELLKKKGNNVPL